MNILSVEKNAKIVPLLVEGIGIRVITQIIGCSINIVTKLLIDAGMTCSGCHDEMVRNVKARRVQCDEIWNFCQSNQKSVAPEHGGILGYGDVWIGVTVDGGSKLGINWFWIYLHRNM